MNVRYIMDRFFTVDILSKTAAAPGDLSHGKAVQTRPFGVRCPRGVDSSIKLRAKRTTQMQIVRDGVRLVVSRPPPEIGR